MSGSAFVADLGVRWQNSDLAVAGYLGNFGSKMKFDNTSEKMPTSARVGVAYNFFNRSLTSSIEYESRFSGNQLFKQGFEFNYQDKYFLRSGYNYNLNSETESFGGFTFGGGLNYNNFEVNYAFTPSGNFTPETLHRFSLIFRFSR